MTNTIFVYKAKRRRNSLSYIPYKKFYNSLYDHIDIDSVIEKIGTENMTSVVCQGNLTGDFVRNALGFDELEDYEDEEDTITVDDDNKGVDVLIVWTDKKPHESNVKKQIQSIRGVAGLFIRRDKNNIKYAEVAIICNASSSRMKTRNANVKTRGKEILQMIDVIAKDKKCKYVALKALDNVITYYHKFGFRLVNYPFHKERPEISEYVGRLGRINTAIDKINNKRSTRKHRKHHDNSKLEKLHGEKDMIMEKFKRFLVGLYDVKERANFRYSETPDTEDETGEDFVEDLADSGYRMYKPLVRRTPNAGRKTMKRRKGKGGHHELYFIPAIAAAKLYDNYNKKTRKNKKTKRKTQKKRGGSAPIGRNVNEGKWLIRNNKDSINYWRNNILPTLNADDDEIQTTTNAMNFFITELEYFDDMGDEEREETMGEDYDRTWNYVELDNGTILFGHTHKIEQSDALEDMQLGPDAEIVDR
tara:strand:- start:194 stop:1618 length:1425 start_codon:yes stop_codon:yes gene_type:complete